MGRIIISVIVCLSLLFIGCAPAKFTPVEPMKIEFDKTPKYELNLDEITIPDKPVKILLDKDLNIIEDVKQAKYVAFAPKEYAKVQAHLEVRKAYKDITIEQEKLINAYVDEINALKELLALEQAKTRAYYELWVNSENAYRQEKYEHQLDNMFNRSVIGVMSVGAIILAILAL